MIAKALETQVHRQADVAVIDLEGEINSFAEDALDAAYAQACSDHPGTILLDFTHVDYINSTGIALIVSLMAKAHSAGCRLVASGLNEHYREIFQITRLSDFMNIYPDQNSALQDTVQKS
jgi:anti-anti-sigma factor